MRRTSITTFVAALSLALTAVAALSNCAASGEGTAASAAGTAGTAGTAGSGGSAEVGGSAGTGPDFDATVDGGGGVAGSGGASTTEDAMADSSPPPSDGPATIDARDEITVVAPDANDAGDVLDPSVVAMMRKVADWQLVQPGINEFDWIHGAMWTGIFATYQTTGDVKYRDAVRSWGQSHNWGLAGAGADNQCAA
jgi:hypothetical protein